VSAVLTAQEPSAKYLVNLQPPLVRHFDLIAQAPGGVTRLRELILTLAVQGKLVPQDPSDEPASELLKKIRAEKNRLIAEGKIKRDKPLAEIADEEKPFELPESWLWVRVPDIYYSISPSGNKLLSSAVSSEGQYPVVDQGQKYVTGFTDDASLVIKIPGPVIVFGDHTKAIKYIDFDFVAGADGTKILRPVHQDEKFFAWQLRSFSLEDRGYARHFKVLNSCLFALPPVLEQSRIVTRVEELMQVCDALEASGQLEAQQHAQLVNTLLGTLTQSETPEALADNWQRIATHFDVLLDRPEAVDALEQTILQLAVRGLLVPQDPTDEPASVLLQKIRSEKDHLIAQGKIKRDKPLPPITDEEKPFDLPQGWEWGRWADVAMKIGDIDHKMPTEVKDGVPYVSPRDFYGENSIDFEGAKKISIADYKELASKIRPQAGDLIYPRYGTIGVVRKVVDDRDFLASYSCAVIKAMHGFVEPDYQHLFSISGCAKDQASAATNKTTQPNVGLKSIQSFAMPLPPLAEQSRIVTRVNELRALCADLRERLGAAHSTQGYLADALVAV
jgi:type I restriction enzyme S subunit